jgi:hypothetical protein
MGGWFLDIYFVYLFKWFARLLRKRGANSWPIIQASVTSSTATSGGLGCPTSEVIYTYEIDGHIFGGRNEKPFITPSSAENYVAAFPAGSQVIVRTKPETPEVSVVLDSDQSGRV